MSTTRAHSATIRTKPGLRLARTLSVKRPRSPDNDAAIESVKRRALAAEAAGATTVARHQDKERRQLERQQKDIEFKEKYSRAFPSFTFHFDAENLDVDPGSLRAKIDHLGGSTDDFFSKHITHLITDLPIPTEELAEKENNPKSKRTVALKSPARNRNRSDDLLKKAVEFKLKIWSSSKLESVLERCLPFGDSTNTSRSTNPSPAPTTNFRTRSLASLLQKEKVNGSTERDPTQRRHDFKYFKRGHSFILVEDMYGKLATIIAKDYAPAKPDGIAEWPVLYCHPQARNPFQVFDEKERRRWERTRREEKERKDQQERTIKEKDVAKLQKIRLQQAHQAETHTRKPGDLRRAASMNNLRRNHDFDLEEEESVEESANASGFWSGNVAASGNSVAITSTLGTTTSTSGHSRTAAATVLMKGFSGREVFTSRKAGMAKEEKPIMGPPAIPVKVLKRSKSTNTIKQPKRQEGQKPGYCECCRAQFKDFKQHTQDRKHRKFAKNDSNFSNLDINLDRIQRKFLTESDEHPWVPLGPVDADCEM